MNGKTDMPENFNWVKARADCSLAQMFKKLEFGVREDVNAANEQRSPSDLHIFSMVTDAGCFSVIRESSIALPVSIEFYLGSGGIKVSSGGQEKFVATLTLNNDGQCRFKVNEEELQNWHVRRMALEDLFFGKGGSPMPRAG
jgi:hypothetical protein